MLLLIVYFLINFLISNAVKNLTVNQSNCINGADLFHPCGFIIDVKGDINGDIRCQLHFNTSNATVEFSNKIISIKSQANNECPHFSLQFLTSFRTYRLATTCGGKIEPVNKTIESFNRAELFYDLQGLISRHESQLEMSLTNLNPDPNACADPDQRTSATILKLDNSIVANQESAGTGKDKPDASDWSIGYYIGILIAILILIVTIIYVILNIVRKRNRPNNEFQLTADEPTHHTMDLLNEKKRSNVY